MKYDLSNKSTIPQVKQKLEYFIEKEYFIELKRILPRSTDKQRRYLHLLLGMFAMEYGETLEFVKAEFYKKKCNPDLYVIDRINPKTGEIRKDLRSSEDDFFDTKKKNLSIERFRNWSASIGIYLPEPNEEAFLRQIESDIERYKQYL